MRKRIFVFLLCVLLIMSLSACVDLRVKKGNIVYEIDKELGLKPDDQNVNEVHTIQLVVGSGSAQGNYKDSYTSIINVEYPVAFVCSDDENEYSGLSRALNDLNNAEKELKLDFIRDNYEYAEERYSESGGIGFESVGETYVRRADTLVVSFLNYDYSYSGGAHGYYGYYGNNYDTTTGAVLTLQDVVTDKKLLLPAVEKELNKHYKEVMELNFSDLGEVLNNEDAFSWTIDYNGITFYFSPYTIAPYAAGAQIVILSNDEYPDIVKPEYKKVPDSYGVEILENFPYFYDVTGDGVADEILVSAYCDNNGNDGSVSININGIEFKKPDWFYDSRASFVHTKDGKNYIYLELTRENDYKETVCYDISAGIRECESVSGGLRSVFHGGEGNVITYDVLTNPESFYLETVTQHISTAFGYKEYRITENGTIETKDKIYRFDERKAVEFTLKMDLEVEVFDIEKEKAKKTEILKVGEKVLYIGTDGEKYAFLKSNDGKTYRVETSRREEDWHEYIDGVSTEDIFDGLFFAG